MAVLVLYQLRGSPEGGWTAANPVGRGTSRSGTPALTPMTFIWFEDCGDSRTQKINVL